MLVQGFLELGAGIGAGMINDFLDSVSRPDVIFMLGAGRQHELQGADSFVLGLIDNSAV